MRTHQVRVVLSAYREVFRFFICIPLGTVRYGLEMGAKKKKESETLNSFLLLN